MYISLFSGELRIQIALSESIIMNDKLRKFWVWKEMFMTHFKFLNYNFTSFYGCKTLPPILRAKYSVTVFEEMGFRN
jgi:hypothetical protein